MFRAYIRLKRKSSRTYEEAMALIEMKKYIRFTLVYLFVIISVASLIFFTPVAFRAFGDDSLDKQFYMMYGEFGKHITWIATLSWTFGGLYVLDKLLSKRMNKMQYWSEYFKSYKS